jgi:methionine sulfoxide reductase heme-binding subunit
MSEMKSQPDRSRKARSPGEQVLAFLAAAGALTLIVAAGAAVARTPVGSALGKSLNELFGIQSTQLMWYITRSAGLVAYLLLWFSTAWGLAVTSKIFDALLHRTFTYDFHQFISLLSIGFIVLHVAVLMADRYLPYSLAQVLVPFLSPYRPLWVGIGVLAFYLCLLVTITFYMRRWIGMQAFRWIHVSSMLAYLGALGHSFFAGTDSSLPAAQGMYGMTFLVVVFLTAYWLIVAGAKRRGQAQPAAAVGSRASAKETGAVLGVQARANAHSEVRSPYPRRGDARQAGVETHYSRKKRRH